MSPSESFTPRASGETAASTGGNATSHILASAPLYRVSASASPRYMDFSTWATITVLNSATAGSIIVKDEPNGTGPSNGTTCSVTFGRRDSSINRSSCPRISVRSPRDGRSTAS